MNSLDPSYLRYIYDGIFNGVIASDNESTLPEGLVGLYEDAFLENIPVFRRQQSLVVFACYALLKKEASILFVSEILQVDETEIFELVGTYSSWFNSPEPGKYGLYHERLRIYFLQKLSEKELERLNQCLIDRLQKAIAEQYKDEFEIYALQFLSDHLLVEAFADETKGNELLGFTKDEKIWNRQIKVSNQFLWTKNSIQNSILWTSKHDLKESVFRYLDLVELNQKEQSDSENIVVLVANNEIDLALKRIETFGGADQEGLQRKFILYMLCLMELTLLNSKTQPWRKEALEKILTHFDEQMPIDHSILNWDDFFSSYLVFNIAYELKCLSLDYLIIYKRTDIWDSEWIKENLQLKKTQFDFIIQLTNLIENYGERCLLLNSISIELFISNRIEDSQLLFTMAIDCCELIENQTEKISILLNLLNQFSNNRLNNEIEIIINKILELNLNIEDNYLKIFNLISISTELNLQNRFEESDSIMKDVFLLFKTIDDEVLKSKLSMHISIELVKQAKFKKAILYSNFISYEYEKSEFIKYIFIELFKKGKINFENLDKYINRINDESTIIIILCKVSSYFFNNGEFEKAKLILNKSLAMIENINDELEKSNSLVILSNELYIQKNNKNSIIYLFEAFSISKEISDSMYKNLSLKDIAIQFAKLGKIFDIINCLECMDDLYYQNSTINKTSTLLIKIGKIEEAYFIFLYSLNFKKNDRLNNDNIRNSLISNISLKFMKSFNRKKSFLCLKNINSNSYSTQTLNNILIELSKINKLDDVIIWLEYIDDQKVKDKIYCDISIELTKNGIIHEVKHYINCITCLEDKDISIMKVIIELTRLDKLIEVKKFLKLISASKIKDNALKYISIELSDQLKFKESKRFINKISDLRDRVFALNYLSNILFDNGRNYESLLNIKLSLKLSRNIINYLDKISLLNNISTSLYKLGHINKSKLVIFEALEIANKINDTSEKISVLDDILIELNRQGRKDTFNFVKKKINGLLKKMKEDWEKHVLLYSISNKRALEISFEEGIFLAKTTKDKSILNLIIESISIDLIKKDFWILAETTILNIDELYNRQIFWKKSSSFLTDKNDIKLAIDKINLFKNTDTVYFFLKGWAEYITINDLSEELLIKALPHYKNDPESIEHLLQTHAINELFFGKATNDEIQKYNRTLNIQWAMDIKHQISI